MKNNIKKLCLFGILASITFCLKICMASLPNIEPVTLTLILYTLLLGCETIYIAIVYVILEILIYGFSIWSIGYLYIWILLVMITDALYTKFKSMTFVVAWSVVFGLIFGALYIPIYLMITDLNTTIAWWLAGIPYDLIHGVSNGVLCGILLPRLYKVCKGELKYEDNGI